MRVVISFFLHFSETVPIIFPYVWQLSFWVSVWFGSQIIRESTDHIIQPLFGGAPRSLHEPSKEQIIAAFSAASWFPQNSMFFLDMTNVTRCYSSRRQAQRRGKDPHRKALDIFGKSYQQYPWLSAVWLSPPVYSWMTYLYFPISSIQSQPSKMVIEYGIMNRDTFQEKHS